MCSRRSEVTYSLRIFNTLEAHAVYTYHGKLQRVYADSGVSNGGRARYVFAPVVTPRDSQPSHSTLINDRAAVCTAWNITRRGVCPSVACRLSTQLLLSTRSNGPTHEWDSCVMSNGDASIVRRYARSLWQPCCSASYAAEGYQRNTMESGTEDERQSTLDKPSRQCAVQYTQLRANFMSRNRSTPFTRIFIWRWRRWRLVRGIVLTALITSTKLSYTIIVGDAEKPDK